MQLANNDLLKLHNYIGGEWCAGAGTVEVRDPANGDLLAEVADGSAADAERAVAAASAAFPAWKSKTAAERAAVLKRWYQLIMDNVDDLARILTLEQGKPLAEAKGEIVYGASFIEWFAEECRRAYGQTIPTHNPAMRLNTIRQPVGVVTCITPWNFPNAMITRKAAPALAAGCTVVIKPAVETPLSALALCQLAEEAGLPKGTINMIVGSDAPAIGKVLTQDPRVAKFTFTGSTAVGKLLMAQCASTVKKMSMELGGNAPFIVFDDADLDTAVSACVATKFRNAGQTCVSTNRIYVHETVHDAFVDKLRAAMGELKVGHGCDEGVTVGPLIHRRAAERVGTLVRDAVEMGAKVELGGDYRPIGENYFAPTLLTGVSDEMRIAREEIFGPLAPVQKFADEEDVIRRANDTPYGLAAYVMSENIRRANRVVEALEYGMVACNAGVFSTTVAPFGGCKESGIGREGGVEGMAEFYETKYCCFGA
ncbi:NAD-dependent succinate-semialdehyde dehydrogenase [Microbulbifer thermotolerans]|uniref:NAD-dependent succinate-semialdehyde dehydrogenase n=1 Tax=Microbulbifer thermotolerans TaxID=252514 RepID=A0AB35HUN8_MICTH|nr:NAD-dependent succinate-semialdehyde dehydrogenase [Microbulbifer thermotolerans]MCX2782133.1 NAD-dependent succinate-semialdehyde dehydrogenase [Microbulbifer thermotolerans]MCX2796065.1 NAD-dependent succinate-semialdehyde dehydrogenase [Microbulbifer thermotolerans]MCX2801207.1 NAD-dependent succinate-semialdehyde dehydrogenase [Microbulbifer thermotolerans]MCX2831362.1 NAD-dependent succinate-semialdehyde dehydrogenase [Microbulbifer thermotolerans]MCX2841398.1 NAD-dependent succinate-s